MITGHSTASTERDNFGEEYTDQPIYMEARSLRIKFCAVFKKE